MVNWRRPLTLIYPDNHKFGTALYEPTLGECERRFVGFSQPRSDLGGLGESSLLSAALRRDGSSTRASPRPKSFHEDILEQRQQVSRQQSRNEDYASSGRSEERGRTPRRQISRQESSGSTHDLKAEIEELQRRIGDNERSARQDASVLRDIMGSRMMELATMLRDAEAHNLESQKIIKRQAQLMGDIQKYCQGLEKKLSETIDELSSQNNKCRSLQSQLESRRC